jgi:hypothetical protein
LSVSVCSTVPGYDQPKCFVSSGSTVKWSNSSWNIWLRSAKKAMDGC